MQAGRDSAAAAAIDERMTSGKDAAAAAASPLQGMSPSCSSDTIQELPDAHHRAQQDCDALLNHARDAATGSQVDNGSLTHSS